MDSWFSTPSFDQNNKFPCKKMIDVQFRGCFFIQVGLRVGKVNACKKEIINFLWATRCLFFGGFPDVKQIAPSWEDS